MERDEKRDYLVSLRESTGMTRKDFAIEYNIPYINRDLPDAPTEASYE